MSLVTPVLCRTPLYAESSLCWLCPHVSPVLPPLYWLCPHVPLAFQMAVMAVMAVSYLRERTNKCLLVPNSL